MNSVIGCPICYSVDMIDFNGRIKARCARCGSLERTRYLYMLLERMGVLRPRMSILHLAPEPGLFRKLSDLSDNYKAADYGTSQYLKWSPRVDFIDLTKVDEILEGRFDLIIHNHVLEHLPCSVSIVLSQLRKRLNPGGVMFFSVPIRENAFTVEDLNPELTSAERSALFGQWDHMHIFGSNDVFEILSGKERNPIEMIDPFSFLSKGELSSAIIPETVQRPTPSSIFRVDSLEI